MSWVFSADLSEHYTDGYPIASGREQEEGLVDLLWYGFPPQGDGGYSESCCPCYFGALWSPRGQFEARYSAEILQTLLSPKTLQSTLLPGGWIH